MIKAVLKNKSEVLVSVDGTPAELVTELIYLAGWIINYLSITDDECYEILNDMKEASHKIGSEGF